jgi:L-rhamnose mutarotase
MGVIAVRLTLNDTEAAELKETLVTVLDEMAVELRRTEGHDYRRLLKGRRDTLHGVLVQLEQAMAAPQEHVG